MMKNKISFTFILIFLFVFKIYGQFTNNHYDRVLPFNDGIAVVIKVDKYGFINESGKEIISCKYECALNFSEGLAAVKENSKWGFINKYGNYVIHNIYDSETASSYFMDDVIFSKGYARVILNGKAIFIDKNGKKIKDCPYERVEPFHFDLSAVKLEGMWGFIDTNLNIVIPCMYSNNYFFNDNWGSWNHAIAPYFSSQNQANITLIPDSLHNVIDRFGRTLLPWCLLIIEIPSKNKISVIFTWNKKYGLINYKCELIANRLYDDLYADFRFFLDEGSRNHMRLDGEDTFIRVKSNNLFGFLIDNGERIIPRIYDQAEDFKNGRAKVKLNGIEFYIDENGDRVI
jgi:WG containing repeat